MTTHSQILQRVADRHGAAEQDALAPHLPALLDEAVARYSERLLWVSLGDGSRLTYREFDDAVWRGAAALHRLGIGRGTHVAIMLPSVPALAIAWMALARLGAVMLPVNTRYTARELCHVLAEGDASLLIVHEAFLPLLQDAVLPLPLDRVVTLGAPAPSTAGEWGALVGAAGLTPALPEPTPDQLMTLQFTSGSSGQPKACMLTHRYWVIIAQARRQQGPAVQRILIDMPFHYMGGQWRFLLALATGATAYVASAPSLAQMLDRLLANGIQFCSVTPALAKQALDPRRRDLSLSWAGTMAVPAHLQGDMEDRLNGAPVREMYGTTETGAALAMPVDVDWMGGSGSAGLPAPFRRLRIVDAAGADVPSGGTGELLIGGSGMMLGYYKRRDLDADVFREGLFRTGDLFRRDATGFYTMLGRIKDVIRRSGENISAAELESVLVGLPEVVEAAAIPVPDTMRGEEVKIYLALLPGIDAAALPPARIMAHCAKQLARFKLPRYIAYLPALPKTSSGKVAKQMLRAPGADLRAGAYDTVDDVWR